MQTCKSLGHHEADVASGAIRAELKRGRKAAVG